MRRVRQVRQTPRPKLKTGVGISLHGPFSSHLPSPRLSSPLFSSLICSSPLLTWVRMIDHTAPRCHALTKGRRKKTTEKDRRRKKKKEEKRKKSRVLRRPQCEYSVKTYNWSQCELQCQDLQLVSVFQECHISVCTYVATLNIEFNYMDSHLQTRWACPTMCARSR